MANFWENKLWTSVGSMRKGYFTLHSYLNVLLHTHKAFDTKPKAWPHFDPKSHIVELENWFPWPPYIQHGTRLLAHSLSVFIKSVTINIFRLDKGPVVKSCLYEERVFRSSLPGLYPLNANSLPFPSIVKMSRYCQMSERQIHLIETKKINNYKTPTIWGIEQGKPIPRVVL